MSTKEFLIWLDGFGAATLTPEQLKTLREKIVQVQMQPALAGMAVAGFPHFPPGCRGVTPENKVKLPFVPLIDAAAQQAHVEHLYGQAQTTPEVRP